MGIVVKNISTSDRVDKTNGARAKSQLDYIGKGEDHEKVERVWFGNTFGEGRIADAEIAALADSNPRARNPTRHLILSWRADEIQPDQIEFDGAVKNILSELKLSDCLYKAAVHRDTDNIHLHLVVCTVDPDNSKMRHTPMIEDKCMKVIARHNKEFNRENHPGDRYVIISGKPVLKNAVRPDSPPVVEKAERATAHGKDSALTVAKERIAEHAVDDATTWPEFHRRLAAGGLVYERVGKNMAKVTLSAYQSGDEYMKASQLDRSWTLAALEKRFGPYVAAGLVLDSVHAGAVVKETVKQADNPKPWEIYKAEKAAAIADGKAKEKKRKTEQEAEREALAAKQNQERKVLQGEVGRWKGRGAEFNAAKSSLAQRHAVEIIELKETQRSDLKAAAGKELFPEWNDWRKQRAGGTVKPEAPAPEVAGQGGDGRALAPKGDLRDFAGRFVASGNVEYSNKFTRRVEFVDVGEKLTFGQTFGDPAIRASLQLAAQKWTVGPLNIAGTDVFKLGNAIEAVRLGIDSRIAGIEAAVMAEARHQVEAERVAMQSAAVEDAQRILKVTKAERLIVTAEKNQHSTRLLSGEEGNQADRLPAAAMAQARELGETVRVLPVANNQIHIDLEFDAAGLAQFKSDGGKPAFVQAGAKSGQFVAVVAISADRNDAQVVQKVAEFKSQIEKRYVTPGELLIECGKARFEHQETGSKSYFVKTQNDDGVEREHWGVDLERAIAASGAKSGDRISLSRAGQQEVTVSVPVKDRPGEFEEKTVKRNGWEVKIIEGARQALPAESGFVPGALLEVGDSHSCANLTTAFRDFAGIAIKKRAPTTNAMSP